MPDPVSPGEALYRKVLRHDTKAFETDAERREREKTAQRNRDVAKAYVIDAARLAREKLAQRKREEAALADGGDEMLVRRIDKRLLAEQDDEPSQPRNGLLDAVKRAGSAVTKAGATAAGVAPTGRIDPHTKKKLKAYSYFPD